MKRSLLILSTLATSAGAAILNVVVVVRDYVGDLFSHVPPFTVTEPAPERLEQLRKGGTPPGVRNRKVNA